MNARLKEIELNDDDSVKCFRLADGSTIEGDLYVSAMPGMLLLFTALMHVQHPAVTFARESIPLLTRQNVIHSASQAVT